MGEYYDENGFKAFYRDKRENANILGLLLGVPGPGKEFYTIVPVHTMPNDRDISDTITKDGHL